MTVPPAEEGISALTLSVEISTIASSRLMCSPGCFNQRRMVPSASNTPSWGISIVFFTGYASGMHSPDICKQVDKIRTFR